MKESQVHQVNFHYTKEELGTLLCAVMDESQMESLRYRAGDKDVLVYPVPPERPMGRIIFRQNYWEDYVDGIGIVALEVDQDFSKEDMLRELAILELRAFGVVKHGKVVTEAR